MSPPPPPAVSDLATWKKFVALEVDPIPTRIRFLVDPEQRPASPRPGDFAIEPTGDPADCAGANPNVVGPWGR
jgi:hypothetical protein